MNRPARQTLNNQPPHPRSWPVRAISLLLLVEAAGLVMISLAGGAAVNWQQAMRSDVLPPQVLDVVLLGGIFIPLAILAVLAALAIFAGFRVGWLLAMIVQAVALAGSLRLYFDERPTFVYPLMLLCIIVVLYLNSRDVRVAFHVRPPGDTLEPPDEP